MIVFTVTRFYESSRSQSSFWHLTRCVVAWPASWPTGNVVGCINKVKARLFPPFRCQVAYCRIVVAVLPLLDPISMENDNGRLLSRSGSNGTDFLADFSR